MGQSLFIRLLTLVDDYARFEYEPQLLASLCYPYGDHKKKPVTAQRIEELIAELEGQDMLVTYAVKGTRYLELNRWTERQRSAAKYPGREQAQSVAGNCQQTLAGAVGCGQMVSPPPTPTPTPTPERERSVAALEFRADQNQSPAAAEDSAKDWGILKARLVQLDKSLESAEGDSRRELLGERKKTRAAFLELSKRQAAAAANKVMGGLTHD